MLNVTKIQSDIKILNDYNKISNDYHFFYDETNNYRKVRIENGKLKDENAFYKNYVLGGICYLEDNKENANIDVLFNEKLQNYNDRELKSKKVFKKCKSFAECLNKPEIEPILSWIDNNCFIHFMSMNCFYFSIIDLADSFFTEEPENLLPKEIHDIFKNQLYHLLYPYKEEFITFANSINYPNIKGENVRTLCDWLISLIEIINVSDDFDWEFMKQIIKSKRKANSLLFLNKNEENTIVESFYSMRQQRCIIFENSFHTFDNEFIDEELMKKYPLTKNDKDAFINYEFINSANNRYVQLSDVIVYLYARFLDFIDHSSVLTINNTINKLNEQQKRNLLLMLKLIKKSYKEDPFLIGTINSMDVNYYRNNMIEYLLNKVTN